MREPNFSSPAQNRAAVVITSTLYDRRALDCTATLPLVNSLTHLAYMTSTSPRIREILAADGGLERLVKILATCQHTDKHSLWKWSLAFQCVVNVGVRGTEAIRSRVVEAGAVHVVLAILENFINALDQAKIEKDQERKQQQQLQQQQQTNHQHMNYTQTALSLPTMPTTAMNMNSRTGATTTANTSNNNNGTNTATTTTTNKIIEDEDEDEQVDDNNNNNNNNEQATTQDGQNNRLQHHAQHNHHSNHHQHRRHNSHHSHCQQPAPLLLFNSNTSNSLFVIPKRTTFITRSVKPKSKPYTGSLSSIPLLNNLSTDAILHREEDILLSLQLLAYLSKYPQIRQAFHSNHRHNVFSVVEKFTHRLHPAAIIYWAGVIMRNACRKDEARGGVRQCANMQCGKWERFPREFAKCRRCRKAKYCSKSCQSKAWADGHRWWCVERPNHTSHPPNPTATSSTTQAAAAAVANAPPPPPPTEQVVHLEDNVVTSDVLAIPITGNEGRRPRNTGGGNNNNNQGGGRQHQQNQGERTVTIAHPHLVAGTGGQHHQHQQQRDHTRRSSLPNNMTTNNNNNPDTEMTPVNRASAAAASSSLYHGFEEQQQRRGNRSVRSLQATTAVQSGSSTEVEADTDHHHSDPRARGDLMDVD